MTRRLRWIGGMAVALVLGLLALRIWLSPIRVAAPEPALTADPPDTLSQVPPSVVTAPIVFDLGPAISQLEEDVPGRFGSMDRRIRADSTARASVAFTASRSPFEVRVEGGQISVETVLEYEGRAWYNPPIGPEVSAGCGGGDGPKPRLRMRLVSTPSLTPEWELRTRTQAEVARFSDDPRDQCQVTFLKIDVTNKVVGAVNEQMARVVERFDGRVAQSDTRGQIERIWDKMARPIRLADEVWLLLQPDAADLESLTGEGDTLTALVRLEARPKIVTGMRPEDSTFVKPLPPLRTTAGDDSGAGLHVVLEGVFTYEAATNLMRKPLVGKTVRIALRRARIEDVTLLGIGSGRVGLGVTFSGAVQGRVFFTGTPQIDLDTRQLTVPDLDFDIGSMGTQGLPWWPRRVVRSFLRAHAVIPDSVALAGVERLAQRGMNRELTEGVRLEVTLNDSRGMAVRATREQLVVRALAEGSARLTVDRVLARAHGTSKL